MLREVRFRLSTSRKLPDRFPPIQALQALGIERQLRSSDLEVGNDRSGRKAAASQAS